MEQRGSDIVFRLTDDGRGLDYASIHAKALEQGVLLPGASPTEMELARLILLPGFSTRDEATQVSGRGIGMDVVYRRINELRGTLTLHSVAGAGTCLEMTLPANLVSAHVGLARSSGGPVAVITNGITQFVPIATSDVERNEKGSWYRLEGERIPVVDLDTLVGTEAPLGRQQEAAVGILVDDENGARHIVLTPGIDEMRSVIVKSFGPYVATVPGVRGATILGTGGVAPVVDLRKLVSDGGWQNIALNSSRVEPAAALQRIVVADDSLSVRRALSQLMTDAGFEVETARGRVGSSRARRAFGSGRSACRPRDAKDEWPRIHRVPAQPRRDLIRTGHHDYVSHLRSAPGDGLERRCYLHSRQALQRRRSCRAGSSARGELRMMLPNFPAIPIGEE